MSSPADPKLRQRKTNENSQQTTQKYVEAIAVYPILQFIILLRTILSLLTNVRTKRQQPCNLILKKRLHLLE